MISNTYFKVNEKSGISPFQNTIAYLGGSAVQTIDDNHITAYIQLFQQYAKNAKGETISPKLAVKEANSVFLRAPINSSFSGLQPRLVGVLFKRIPKFGFLLGYDFFTGGKGEPGFAAATTASILSAPFINPVRMIEKQQRVGLKLEGKQKQLKKFLKKALNKTTDLYLEERSIIGHSLASALLGLVGQPKLQKYIQSELDSRSSLNRTTTNLLSLQLSLPYM